VTSAAGPLATHASPATRAGGRARTWWASQMYESGKMTLDIALGTRLVLDGI
jgi:hypothetical protein